MIISAYDANGKSSGYPDGIAPLGADLGSMARAGPNTPQWWSDTGPSWNPETGLDINGNYGGPIGTSGPMGAGGGDRGDAANIANGWTQPSTGQTPQQPPAGSYASGTSGGFGPYSNWFTPLVPGDRGYAPPGYMISPTDALIKIEDYNAMYGSDSKQPAAGLPTPDLTSTGQTPPISGMNFNPTTNSYNPIPTPATNLGALAGVAGITAAATQGKPMANLLQGSPLPNITTSQTATTTAPDWYNQFLSGLSTSGQAAVNTGGIAGASPLQTLAYNNAPTAINAGQPTLTQATDVATGAAGPLDINQYMNPYTTGVVDEIGRLGKKNFTDILGPNAVAGAAGSGQFNSRRGMKVYGDVARDSARATTGQQATALSTGFDNAIKTALQKQQNETQAGNLLGTLSSQDYTQGVGGLNVLSGLGAQQQATEQAGLNYPMSSLKNFSDLLRGFTVPTRQDQTFTGPIPGAYSNSPLSQIAGLGLSTAGLFANKIDPRTGLEIKGTSVFDTIKNAAGFGNQPTTPGGTAPSYTTNPADYGPPYSPPIPADNNPYPIPENENIFYNDDGTIIEY